jgi:hypothetical protein
VKGRIRYTRQDLEAYLEGRPYIPTGRSPRYGTRL